MKTVFKFLFALCILSLIGSNQLSARDTSESKAFAFVEGQQFGENSDIESLDAEQDVNTRSPEPTTVEIPILELSEFGAEEKHTTYPVFVTFFNPLVYSSSLHNNRLSVFFKGHHSFAFCRKYLLFEVFRI